MNPEKPTGQFGEMMSVGKAVWTETKRRLFREKEAQIMLKMMEGLGKDSKVLDVGGNLGDFAKQISERTGASVVRMDNNPSDAMHRFAKENVTGHNVDILRGSGEEMPIKDNTFDCVVMSHILEHFENPDRLLEETTRALKKDGYLIVSVPKEHHLGEFSKDHKLCFKSLDELVSFLNPYGYEPEETADLTLSAVAKFKMNSSLAQDKNEL